MSRLTPMAPTLDYADIRALLPHHHPNLLVDRVVRCEPGTMIETTKAVSASEPCYAELPDTGHEIGRASCRERV